jgi:hypothetical protein
MIDDLTLIKFNFLKLMKRYGRWQGWTKNNDYVRVWTYNKIIYVEINNDIFNRREFEDMNRAWDFIEEWVK